MKYEVWLSFYADPGDETPTEELVARFKYKTQAIKFVSAMSNDHVSARVVILDKTMTESSITLSRSFTTFAGPDATELYRAAALRSALGLLEKGIAPTRGVTLTKTLKLVERYTGKTYKRTEAARARADLTVWIETMKSAIPMDDLRV